MACSACEQNEHRKAPGTAWALPVQKPQPCGRGIPMTEDTVQSTINGRGIAHVTLNRPAKGNAFDDTMIIRLRETFQELAGNSSVRVVVLRAEGRHFSAGADLAWMRRMADYDYGHNYEDAQQLAGMLGDLYALPQATIAQVHGAAYGGAVGLVSCCDMAIASSNASFALSEVRLGLIPATISPYVIRAVGERAARRLFMTGESIDAGAAYQLGLVSEVCESDQLEARTRALTDTLLRNGPLAVRAAKDLINRVAGAELSAELIGDTCARIAHTRVSEEGQAGLIAFLNKSSPPWHSSEQEEPDVQ